MQNINRALKSDQLVKLVQKDNFVGWVYSLDYDTALIMANDLWKYQAQGVPHNSFLVAASFDPDAYADTHIADREVILLRVVGSAKLPQDDDLIRTKIDHYKDQPGIYPSTGLRAMDDITQNQMQFGGLKCRVLGTFFQRDSELWLGSDLESFAMANRLRVYRPRTAALEIIVNYIDPLRRQKAEEEAKELGFNGTIAPFPLGTVRYTSTDRMHRNTAAELVSVRIQPFDLLARRSAVLGMTRTGKSNMVKQMVSVVKQVADEGGRPIGQIIYDINGEYANANNQDKGAIASLYTDETIRYRMLQTPGFLELQNNFYLQLNEGFGIIREKLDQTKSYSIDVTSFLENLSLDEPEQEEYSAHSLWRVRCAAYQALLYRAGFEPPRGHTVKFEANEKVRAAVQKELVAQTDDEAEGSAKKVLKNPKDGLTVEEAAEWFSLARAANKRNKDAPLLSTGGKPWLEDIVKAMLNMMENKNESDSNIKGHRVLAGIQAYHSPRRAQEIGDEIYGHLAKGRIVILDLSVGDPTLRERISQQIARDIFNKSMMIFVKNKVPPNIVVYIEEAHNLIGKDNKLTDTWPRLAKEGAKYRIALVYATQEVSSVHPNILANTENWFVTHLNNENEIKELAKFYDFADFSRSLIRAQDVGFARVKTLSSPFVIPVQIDKFDPEAEQQRLAARAATKQGSPAQNNGTKAVSRVQARGTTSSPPMQSSKQDELWDGDAPEAFEEQE